MSKTTVVQSGRATVEAPTAEEAARVAAQAPREMRLDGHRVVEALREAHAIRATTSCGEVVTIALPLVEGKHDTRGPVTCGACFATYEGAPK